MTTGAAHKLSDEEWLAQGDELWKGILTEDDLSEARGQAEHQFRDLSSDQITHLRARCKTDLFFLCSGPLEYDLLSPNLHGHYCRWLEATRHYQFRLKLLPRGHYKSTVDTIGESIQMALPNVGNVQDHPFDLGPNVKVLLAHENRESASRFLFEIAEAFLRKPLMLALFPECVPSLRKQRINKWELELPREAHHKEPTFDTIGGGGAAQSRHYNRLKIDDIVGEAARDSDTVMRTTNNWFDNINSLLTRPKFDGWDLTGTRWADNDTYNRAIEVYGIAKMHSFIRALEREDVDKLPDGVMATYWRGVLERTVPIFPEEFDLPFINRLRKNPLVFAAQYANNPRESGLTEFSPGWLRFYNVGNGPNIYVFAGESSWKVNVWELDRVILIDPAVSENKDNDESGIIVCGTDKKMNVYILDAIQSHLKPPDLIDKMFELYTKWSPRLISVEEVNFSAVYKYWFYQKCKTLGIHPSIYPYKPGSQRTKDARIRGLTHYFSAGQVFILEGMHAFRDQYERFPLGKTKHLLDALAQGPEVWTPGLGRQDQRERELAEKAVQDYRDAETGY